MGYITSGATVYIDCFLTQKGKELFFIGEDEDIIVKYFTLGDSDTNYIITNNINITTQDDNILTEGFIPSITGNYDECTKSIAGGIKLKSEIPVKAINKVLNQYCEGQTLVETLRDPNGNVFIKKTAYSSSCGFNYYSAPVSQSFTPNITPIEPTYITGNYDTLYQNYYIAPYTVTIPYGTFTSGVSQLDADNKTVSYINENGQTIANNNAVVTYYSRERYFPNEKLDNSLIYPDIYSRVDLFYAPNLFTSNTYIDNNNKINNFVQTTKQNYLDAIKPSLTIIKPNNVDGYNYLEDRLPETITNVYTDFVSSRKYITDSINNKKYIQFNFKNKFIDGAILPFILQIDVPANIITRTHGLLLNSNDNTNKLNMFTYHTNATRTKFILVPGNPDITGGFIGTKYSLLDNNNYNTLLIEVPLNDTNLDDYVITPFTLKFQYNTTTDTYIIPETSVTVPVPNNNTYKGATLYLDKTTKKYNNVDVLI